MHWQEMGECLSSYVFYDRQRILLFNWRWKCSWSENHRVVWVGKEPWRLSSPTPCAQSRISMLFYDYMINMLFRAVSSWIFNTFKVGNSTTSLGNLFQGLFDHPCSTIVLSLGITKSSLEPQSLLDISTYWFFLHLSFLFSKLSNSSSFRWHIV